MTESGATGGSSGLHQVRIATLARTLFWAALAFAVTMALLPHPPAVAGDLGDKYQHMLAFGILTILACAGFPRAELFRLGERLSFVGAMIEVLQSIPSLHRDCDIGDWIADTVVIAAVLLVFSARRRRQAGIAWANERKTSDTARSGSTDPKAATRHLPCDDRNSRRSCK